MNFRPSVVEGSIIDLPIDPRVALKWVTNTPGGHGPAIKEQPKPKAADDTPKDLGEERHHQLLSAIKGINVSQNVSQKANVADALAQNRDWRR